MMIIFLISCLVFTLIDVYALDVSNLSDFQKSDHGVKIKFCSNFDPDNFIDPYTVDASMVYTHCHETYKDYSPFTIIFALIHAPSWNTNPFKIDTIGNTETNPITVYTGSEKKTLVGIDFDPINGVGLCTGLRELGPDTGLFAGKIALTGFQNDFDGDGVPDDFGITNCGTASPYGQFGANAVNLKTDRQGSVTLGWEVVDGFSMVKSASYSYHTGDIFFDKELYDVGDFVTVTLLDNDLRQPPGKERYWIINAWSDSDPAGIELKAFFDRDLKIPFSLDGTHSAQFLITDEKESIDNYRLLVAPGDQIFVRYDDYTLPPPYGTEEYKKTISSAYVRSLPNHNSVQILGLDMDSCDGCKYGSYVEFLTTISNAVDSEKTFGAAFIIKQNDLLHSTTWTSVNGLPNSTFSFTNNWQYQQNQHGNFTITVRLYENIQETTILHDEKTFLFKME